MKRRTFLIGTTAALIDVSGCGPEARGADAPLRFEVGTATGLSPASGRLMVALAPAGTREPWRAIGEVGPRAIPTLGRDVDGFGPGKTAVLDGTADLFPLASLKELRPGRYVVQAVLSTNPDLRSLDAPGTRTSEPQTVPIDPLRSGTVALTLSRIAPPEKPPADTASVRFVRIPSAKLSAFHKRPIFLRAGVVLPTNFATEPNRRYGLRVSIGGFGTRYTAAWGAPPDPRFVQLFLDGDGPFGDPYQVNSANNGPYGDAVTQELIPHVEATFRCIGTGKARVLDGGSTGGWVSFALQVFYPDFFAGTWSFYPDGVDLRSFQLVNIYEDTNAYVDASGKERPAMRRRDGSTVYTMRHECQMENVKARGGKYPSSGGQWGAWNAVYGARGADGRPVPLWDPKTGRIDRSTLDQWKKYDLRCVLVENEATLAPKLRGKLRIWVGEADDYFLNNAVHRLDDALKATTYDAKITYGPGQGHGWQPISDRQMLDEMARVIGVS